MTEQRRLFRVLLIEDDEDDYVVVRELLSEIGWGRFDLDWVSSYEAALQQARQDEHDVLLLDYRLGERTGLELIHELQTDGCSAPIVFLTGQGDHDVDVQAMQAGAADYLDKNSLDCQILERSIRYAVERARTLEALRSSEKKLRSMSARLLEAQERERKLFARQLHDSVGASLTAIIYSLEEILTEDRENRTSQLGDVLSMVRSTIAETRSICTHLRPSILDDLGILATIRWFCREFQKLHGGIRIETQLDVQERDVEESLKTVIYRILQEALNNVAKHSGATLARIILRKSPGAIELLVEDNGKGFEMEQLRGEEAPSGMGLASMRERTELSSGSFALTSCPDAGTRVRASWPRD
jgi:signal transduction histidine kinase